MAEQYSSFNSQGPNIDVNLFVNAASAGINQGNAQDTTLGSIFKGVSKGVQSGIATYTAVQQAQSAAAQAEVDTDEGVIQARKDYEIEKARLEKNKAETEAKTGALDAQNQSKVLEAQGAQAEQKLGDTRILQTLTDLLAPGSQVTGEQINAVLDTPAVRGTLSRNSDQVASVLAQARAKGADPARLDAMGQQFEAAQLEKQRLALLQAQEKSIQDQALKTQQEFSEASTALQVSSPTLKAVMNKPDFNGNNLHIVRANAVETDENKVSGEQEVRTDAIGNLIYRTSAIDDDDKRYWAVSDGKIVATYDQKTGEDLQKQLQNYKIGYNARVTIDPRKGGVTQTQGNVPTDNLGLASQRRVDTELQQATPGSVSTTIQPSVPLSPAAQARFDARVSKLNGVPREAREIVRRVENNPILKDQAAIIKGLASQESGGRNDATSPTDVKGLLQVTDDTFKYVKEKYPELNLTDSMNNTPRGELLAGKLYLFDMLKKFGDMKLALAAYNAGPGPVIQAIKNSKGKTWDTGVKEEIQKYVSKEKYEKELKNFPDNVLRFTSYYGR